jgi:uncharacterized protein DUF4336
LQAAALRFTRRQSRTPKRSNELAQLGSVESIVWPSWWHDLYMRAWASAYPAAKLYVAPALNGARRSLTIAGILSEDEHPWPGVELVNVDQLSTFFDEFVFYHRPSRSLIVADLIVNVGYDVPLSSKMLFRLIGAYPGPRIPWSYRIAIRNKKRLREKLDRVFAWDFDAIVVGHGGVVRTGGKPAFQRAVREFLGDL